MPAHPLAPPTDCVTMQPGFGLVVAVPHALKARPPAPVFFTKARFCGAGAMGFSAASLAARLARFC